MNRECRNCGNQNIEIWKGWELCDKCGHRHHIKTGWQDPLTNKKTTNNS
jgi:hypothetical protein